jgi:hypothetical protein
LEVTSGGVFWIVAFGPARCAIRNFDFDSTDVLPVF